MTAITNDLVALGSVPPVWTAPTHFVSRIWWQRRTFAVARPCSLAPATPDAPVGPESETSPSPPASGEPPPVETAPPPGALTERPAPLFAAPFCAPPLAGALRTEATPAATAGSTVGTLRSLPGANARYQISTKTPTSAR